MPIVDLHSNIAKLIKAAKQLEEDWQQTKLYWHDQASAMLEEKHLQQIFPNVKLAVDATNRMAEILSRAERDCSE